MGSLSGYVPAGFGEGNADPNTSNVVFYLDATEDITTLTIPDLDLQTDIKYELTCYFPFKSGGHAMLKVNTGTDLNFRGVRSDGSSVTGRLGQGLSVYNGGIGTSYFNATFIKAGNKAFVGQYSIGYANAQIETGVIDTNATYGADENLTDLTFTTNGSFAIPTGARIILTKPLYQA